MPVLNNNNRRTRRALRRLALLCVLMACLLTLWQFLPVGEWRDPQRLGSWLDALKSNPWAGPMVVAVFLLGSFLVLPVSALIAATGIALGPVDGLLWALIGSLVAATVTYGAARLLPGEVLDEWIGLWIRRLGMRFERRGIVAVMVARNIPIAPFTLINLVAGASNIRYRDFLIGTLLGMGPIIAALTVLGDRLRGVIEAPTTDNIILLGLAVVVWFVIGLSLQKLSNRLAAVRS